MTPEETAAKYGRAIDNVSDSLEMARRSMAPRERTFQVTSDGFPEQLKVARVGVGPLKTDWGRFHLFSFQVDDRWQRYTVFFKGEVTRSFDLELAGAGGELLMRIDSGCETGQIFHDKTCECREQLHDAILRISEAPVGMVIHIPNQDGRGLGLPFKLATLRLIDEVGVDTIEASAMLDPDGSRDTRTYAGVVAILRFLNIDPAKMSLAILTNNPKKVPTLEENGYKVRYVPILIPPTELTRPHLEAKQKEMGHKLGFNEDGDK